MASITVDLKQVDRLSAEFLAFPKTCIGAEVNAINRAITKAKKEISNEVLKEYSPKKGKSTVNKTIKVKRASRANMTGEIDSTGSRLRVADFKYKGQSFAGIGKMGRPLSVTIKKETVSSSHMFTPYRTGSKRTGARGVYTHKKGSKSFEPKYTVAVPQMISNDKVYERIAKMMKEHYEDRLFNHELPYMIKAAQARISGA